MASGSFKPRNDTERAISKVIPGFAKGEVFNVQTREEFLAANPEKQSITGDFDYFVSTGQQLTDGWIFAGETVGVEYDSEVIVLEILERWI